MAIKIDCPRCKKSLSVPRKKAGGYVHCPECSGRFWVPKDDTTPEDATPNDAVATAPPGSSPQSIPIPTGMASTDPIPPPPPPPSATPDRNVARFIPAEAAQSKLDIAEDGQLPDLQLHEGDKKKKDTDADGDTSINPLLLFAVLCLSVVLSVFGLIYEPQSAGNDNSRAKQKARMDIEKHCFVSDIDSQQPPRPYEALLREALLAYDQKNPKKEQKLYRRVLQMLRAERPEEARGLTGSRDRDDRLDENLSILLDDS